MKHTIAVVVSLVVYWWLSTATESLAQPPDRATTPAPAVSSIAALISTPRSHSYSGSQIRIRGTVSVVAGMLGDTLTSSDKSFCLEDDSAGIWVRVKQAMDEGLLEDESALESLRAGMEVEIEGSLNPGGFAPVVLPRRIVILGEGQLRNASNPDLKDFFRGAYIMRRVTVGGVVQNVTDDSPGWLVRVETGAGHFLTRLPATAEFTPQKLMDAEIQVTGVAGASRNWRSQFVCPRVMIAHQEDVNVVRSAAKDPFDADRVRVSELDGFSLKGRSLHRRCLEGVVTYYDGDQHLYLLNDDVGVRLELNDRATDDIRVGDWVEASGFIDATHYLHGLRGAVVRRLGKRAEIIPVETTIREIIDDHFTVPTWKQVLTKTYDGRVVSLRGEVLSFDQATDRTQTRIELATDETTFTASLHEPIKELSPGTVVSLSGIARIAYAPSDLTTVLAEPQRVDLLLRSADDIQIIRAPSWWTVDRITGALALAVTVAGFAMIWGVTLNRRVAKQTQQLASEMRSRRDAAIEFQAAIRERTQLAANIHDTVLQTLAGIGCQLDACGQSAQGDQASTYLTTASRMVQGGQEDLRNLVSALHCLPLEDQTFGESVKRVVKRLERTTGDGVEAKITVSCAGDLPKLADFIAGNLLLIIQEATRNAIKHSKAKHIDITIAAVDHGTAVTICVEDDGHGFNVESRPGASEGHFGLETMKGRAERIGGELSVTSEPGRGARVTASAPLRSFDEAIT